MFYRLGLRMFELGSNVARQRHIIMTRRPVDLRAAHRIFTALAGNAASPEDSAILIKDAASRWERQAPPAT